jgi:hypothetical protein
LPDYEYFSADDTIRECRKVREALDLAIEYHTKTSEANAALHCSPNVLYSPLVGKLLTARFTLDRLIGDGDPDA